MNSFVLAPLDGDIMAVYLWLELLIDWTRRYKKKVYHVFESSNNVMDSGDRSLAIILKINQHHASGLSSSECALLGSI